MKTIPGLVLVLLVTSSGCVSGFAPPARVDLDFAATRVVPGRTELQATLASADEGSGQFALRQSVGDRDSLEVFALDHGVPGERQAFAMAGVGYRRHLSQASEPVQATLGFGLAAGIGGSYDGWPDGASRAPPVVAAYADIGVAWRIADAVSLYGAGRATRSTGVFRERESRPPTTAWVQFGGGARVDLDAFYATFDLSHAGLVTRKEDEDGLNVNLSLGWRFGSTIKSVVIVVEPVPLPVAMPEPATGN